jgi:uncharacterized membrane protein
LPCKAALAAITGVMELAFGVMLLFDRTRIFAARALIMLFIAYVPAIVHMYTHDVFPIAGTQFVRVAMRVIMFPHHVILLVWLCLRHSGR